MASEKTDQHLCVDLMKATDIPEILEIECVSYPTPWTERMFLDEIKTSHAQCLVVKTEIEGRSIIAAYIIFWLIADEVHLHNLTVRPEFRRQGLALNLIKLMKDIGHQVGATRQTLEVRESNIIAINLYRKCGFIVKGRRPLYYTDTQEDALIMWSEK